MAEAAASARSAGHSPDNVSVRALAIGGAAIIATVVIAIVVAFVLVHGMTPARLKGRIAAEPSQPPPIAAPERLQYEPASDIARFKAQKQQLLHGYGWVDRAHGIAHIPIDEAMKLLVDQQKRATP